jgi:uncharacterized protein
MRSLTFLLLVFISTGCLAQKKQTPDPFIRALPQPPRAVNDFGRFLTASEKQELETELRNYHARTTNAIVIITLDSLTDPATKKEYTIEETALLYFNKWGIGDSVKNNGVLLMVSRIPRRVRITVGKGLEHILTNNICQQIIDNNLVPAFKAGRFYAGLKDAIAAIESNLHQPPVRQAAVEAPAQPHGEVSSDFRGYSADRGSWVNYIFFFLVMGGAVMVFFLIIVKIIKGEVVSFSSIGYRGYNNRFISSGRTSGFSSGASFSSSSSSSSFSGSFRGGSSSGGGASGSW